MYQPDELTPSIEAAKKLAQLLEISIGYLLDDNKTITGLFRDSKKLSRLL